MPPAAKAAALVLCMDVGFSMSNSAPGQESPFDAAKKIIQKFVQRQVFAETKDELALVLFGTDSTNNELASTGQYQNITIHRKLSIPDFELLEEIQNQIQPENQQSDWIDALVVCMDLLQRESQVKKYDRLNIALLTDLSTHANKDQLEIIVQNLSKDDVNLQFFLPFPVDSNDDNEADGDTSGSNHGGRDKALSKEQQRGLYLVKEIMQGLDDVDGLDEVYSFSNAIEKLSMFKCIEKKPMAWPCMLTIGSTLSIRIVGYKAVTREMFKKSWLTVDAQSHNKEDVKRETVYCRDDDNETEVPSEETIQGFRYGSDIVPFSKVDQEQMKYKHDGKCFAVLGFAKQNLVPQHQFMGNQVLKVFAPADDEHAGVALSALIRALDELRMVAIVRYAYAKNTNPQVGAAFPCVKEKYECLMYVQLPFMEDLRQFTYPSLERNKKFNPSDAQLAAVDSLIDSMMLVDEDESGKKEDLFKVHHIPNPAFQRLFQCLHHRAVNPSLPLPSIEPWLKAILEPPRAISACCKAPLEKMKHLFPLKEVEKKKQLKTSAQIFGEGSEEPDSKKARVDGEDEEEFSLADISEGAATSVGSVDPVRDFLSLIKQQTLPFGEVCQQLTQRIEQLLSNKNTHYFMKCISCIQTFREQSIKLENADLFNSYLQSLKRSIPERGLLDFWDLLVQDAITLITNDEVDASTTSKEEAAQFLVTEEQMMEAAVPVVEEEEEVDDLLDMM